MILIKEPAQLSPQATRQIKNYISLLIIIIFIISSGSATAQQRNIENDNNNNAELYISSLSSFLHSLSCVAFISFYELLPLRRSVWLLVCVCECVCGERAKRSLR